MSARAALAGLAVVGLLGGVAALVAPPAEGEDPAARVTVRDGVRVALELAARRDGGPVRPGEPADLVVRFTDAASGVPLTGLHPLGWVSPSDGAALGEDACAARVRALAQGSLTTQAATSLNQHFVYTLNGDNTLSVVNPLLAFQRTRLRDLVTLAGRPADAVPGFDADTLVVSVPARGEVALVDTLVNRARTYLDVGGAPGRLVREPGGARVWVALRDGGWAVVDTVTEAVAGRVAGVGEAVAFDRDGVRAFVAGERALVAIDTATLAAVGELPLDTTPTAIAAAPHAGGVVVAGESGAVQVVDARSLAVRAAATLGPGIGALGVDPSGRWAFVVEGARGLLTVLDTATGGVVGTTGVPLGADELLFTETSAYVGGAATATLAVVPLGPIRDGEGVTAATVPGGTPADAPDTTVRAPSMIALPSGDGVLVARPNDRSLLFYAEGMNAPVGGIGNSSPTPARGLVPLDRGLREVAPGTWRAGVTLPTGHYDVPVLVEAPRTLVCFALRVGDPTPTEGPSLAVVAERAAVRAGADDTLAFRLTRADRAVDGVDDVRVLLVRPGSNWQRRLPARDDGDGTYVADVRLPAPGDYRALVESRTLGVGFGDLPPLRVTAEGGGR